jgi:hypothetical protein
MPYHIRSAGHGKAQVVKTATGEPLSKKPIPIARAKAQMRAVYANEDPKTSKYHKLLTHGLK